MRTYPKWWKLSLQGRNFVLSLFEKLLLFCYWLFSLFNFSSFLFNLRFFTKPNQTHTQKKKKKKGSQNINKTTERSFVQIKTEQNLAVEIEIKILREKEAKPRAWILAWSCSNWISEADPGVVVGSSSEKTPVVRTKATSSNKATTFATAMSEVSNEKQIRFDDRSHRRFD